MLSGYYTAASGLLTRQRQLDTIGNNLINSETPGYKADRIKILSFEQELINREVADTDTPLSTVANVTAAVVGDNTCELGAGDLYETGRTCDIAINGEGYFRIQKNDGSIGFTRNGHFALDENGYLELPGHGRVLGSYGPIYVKNDHFTISSSGDVRDENDRRRGSISIVVGQNNATPIKQKDGLFAFPDATRTAYDNYALHQGMVENSNVDLNREMTQMISAQRAFQACSTALQIQDGINQKATKIASV